MAERALVVLFWTWPILLGLVVWVSKASFVVRFTDSVGSWLATTRVSLRNSPSRLGRYWGRPTVSLAHFPFAATAAIPNSFLRTGARVAIVPYVAALICMATFIALELAIAFGCVFLMFITWGFISNLLSSDKDDGAPEVFREPLSRIRGTRLVKTGFFGDSPTGRRIDETGRVMQEGFLGDTPSGVRVTEDGRIMEEGFLADSPTGLKVNAEGQLVEEGFLGDRPTGKKVDQDGRVVDEGFFGDSPTGYKFEKE